MSLYVKERIYPTGSEDITADILSSSSSIEYICIQQNMPVVSGTQPANTWNNILSNRTMHQVISNANGLYIVHYNVVYTATATDNDTGGYIITSRLNGLTEYDQYIGRVTKPCTPVTNTAIDSMFIYRLGNGDYMYGGGGTARLMWSLQLYCNTTYIVHSFNFTMIKINDTFDLYEL